MKHENGVILSDYEESFYPIIKGFLSSGMSLLDIQYETGLGINIVSKIMAAYSLKPNQSSLYNCVPKSDEEYKNYIDSIYSLAHATSSGKEFTDLYIKENGKKPRYSRNGIIYVVEGGDLDKYLDKAEEYMSNPDNSRTILGRYLGVSYREAELIYSRLRYLGRVTLKMKRKETIAEEISKKMISLYDLGNLNDFKEYVKQIFEDGIGYINKYKIISLLDDRKDILKLFWEVKKERECEARAKRVGRDTGYIISSYKTCTGYLKSSEIYDYINENLSYIVKQRIEGKSFRSIVKSLYCNEETFRKCFNTALLLHKDEYSIEDIFIVYFRYTSEEVLKFLNKDSDSNERKTLKKASILRSLRAFHRAGFTVPDCLRHFLEDEEGEVQGF